MAKRFSKVVVLIYTFLPEMSESSRCSTTSMAHGVFFHLSHSCGHASTQHFKSPLKLWFSNENSETWKSSGDSGSIKYFPPTTGVHCLLPVRFSLEKRRTAAKRLLKITLSITFLFLELCRKTNFMFGLW